MPYYPKIASPWAAPKQTPENRQASVRQPKTVQFRDKRTGKVYDMPWEADTPPSETDALKFVDQQEHPTAMQRIGKAWDAATKGVWEGPAKAGKALGEPLMAFGEEGEVTGTKVNPKTGRTQNVVSAKHPILGPPAKAAGAWLQNFGQQTTDLTSPLNAGLAVASGGSSLAAKAGAPTAARLLKIPQALTSLGMMAHGSAQMLSPFEDRPIDERAMGGVEALLGYFGRPRAGVQTRSPREPIPPGTEIGPARPAPRGAPKPPPIRPDFVNEGPPPPRGRPRSPVVEGEIIPDEAPPPAPSSLTRAGLPERPRPFYSGERGTSMNPNEVAGPPAPIPNSLDIIDQTNPYVRKGMGPLDQSMPPWVRPRPADLQGTPPIQPVGTPATPTPGPVKTGLGDMLKGEAGQPDPMMRGFSDDDIVHMAQGGDASAIKEMRARPSLTEKFKQLFSGETGTEGDLQPLMERTPKSGAPTNPGRRDFLKTVHQFLSTSKRLEIEEAISDELNTQGVDLPLMLSQMAETPFENMTPEGRYAYTYLTRIGAEQGITPESALKEVMAQWENVGKKPAEPTIAEDGSISGTLEPDQNIDDIPQFARAEQDGKKGIRISQNIRRSAKEVTSGYDAPLESIMIREAMQNALDAVKKQKDQGSIHYALDNDRFTVADNGPGMNRKEIETVFTDLFESGKTSDSGATGGKGIGKASYMLGGNHFTVTSVAMDKKTGQKTRYTLSGTPDELMDFAEIHEEPVADSTPTGVKIMTVFAKNQYNWRQTEMLSKIRAFSRGVQAKFNNKGRDEPFHSGAGDKVIFNNPIQTNKIKMVIPLESQPKKGEAVKELRDTIHLQYLNNGMYQFSEPYYLGKLTPNMPENVLIDITPTVEEGDPEYPFPGPRESVKETLKIAIQKELNERLIHPQQEARKNVLKELYESMQKFNSGWNSDQFKRNSVLFDPGERLTKAERAHLQMDDTMNALMLHTDESLDHILSVVGDEKWIKKLEGTGVVMDPGMYGVHIPNPTKDTYGNKKSTILINYFEHMLRKDPKQAAYEAMVTMLHEVAHIGEESTSGDFSDHLNPEDLADPNIGPYLKTYLSQVATQGGIDMGHQMGFIRRLGLVYAKFGPRRAQAIADEVENLITDEITGGYSKPVQRLLQIYSDSRGRPETSTDFLSGTGTKQANPVEPKSAVSGPDSGSGTGAIGTLLNKLDELRGDERGSLDLTGLRAGLDRVISPKMRESLRKVYDDLATSGLTVIRNQHGESLEKLLIRNRLDGEQLAGNINARLKEIVSRLSPEELRNYVQVRDGKERPMSAEVMTAVKEWKKVDDFVTQAAKASGMGMKRGKRIVPFQEMAAYWAHIYPSEFFEAKNKPSAINQIMNEGYSYQEAERILDRASKYNERLIDPQHGRVVNAPGYRTDLDVDYQHYNDMARRIQQAFDFGPRDTADPNSPISQLVAMTDNPARVAEILEQYLGRGKASDPNWARVNANLSKFQTFTKLSRFIINNTANLGMLPLRASLGGTAEGIGKVFANYPEARAEAERTGALQSIYNEVVKEVGGPSGLSRWFGIQKSEELLRTISAIAGKRTAQDLFQRLAKNPADMRTRQRLENLILESPDKLLRQGGLTDKQTNRAGNRMSEITQGRASNIDLPKMWSNDPKMVALMMFKRYAFQQSKNIWAAMKQEHPLKVAIVLVGLMEIMGELTGDANAVLRGTGRTIGKNIAGEDSDLGEEIGGAIAERGQIPTAQDVADWIANPTKQGAADNLERFVNNLSQSWALGYLGDIASSMRQDKKGLAANLAGPVVGDIGETGYNIGTLNGRGLAQQAARMVPLFGSGLADSMKATNEGRQRRRARRRSR